MTEDNNGQLSLGIDFTRTEAGEVEISAVSRPDAEDGARVGDVVDWIDDGLSAEGLEQMLAGFCDGTRPRHWEIPITMRVRRAGEALTVKVRWLFRISDEAAVAAPVSGQKIHRLPTRKQSPSVTRCTPLPCQRSVSRLSEVSRRLKSMLATLRLVTLRRKKRPMLRRPHQYDRSFPPNCLDQDRQWFDWHKLRKPRSAVGN